MRRDAAHRILFVEPSAVLRRRLENLAQSHGWDAVGCEDIPAAEQAVQSATFDLVVTAGRLNSGDFRDVVARLRTQGQLATSPIILFTGQDVLEIESEALALGVTEIFSETDFAAFETYLQDQTRSTEDLVGVKALVLEDDPVVCQFVIEILQQMALQVDGYTQMEEAQAAVHARPYRLIVADLVLDKGQSGNKFIRTLRHSNGRSSDALIIAISAQQDPARRLDALRAGADIFLSKPFSEEELSTQVRHLLSRLPDFSGGHPSLSVKEGFHLSKRERMICGMVVAGHPDKQIAARLGISFWTVRTHMSRIFRKCGVNNRVELSNLLRGSAGNDLNSGPLAANPASVAQSAVIEWLSLASHVVDGLGQGIVVTDDKWNTIYTNPSFSRISGYGGNELLGKKSSLIHPPAEWDGLYPAIIAALEARGQWSGALPHFHRDGTLRPGRVAIQRLPAGMPLQACYVLELMEVDAADDGA